MTRYDTSLALLSRALDQTGAIVARVRSEQATLPTPCRSWTVRTLVNHVVDELYQFSFVVGGGKRRQLGDDVLGDDWAGTYRVAADALLSAWRQPGALDRPHRLPGGELPATWAVGQHITEVVIHGWDIATATGQPTDLDAELGRYALAWQVENVRAEFRGDEAAGHHIGPEVTVADEAPLYDRLAAFAGRDPNGVRA